MTTGQTEFEQELYTRLTTDAAVGALIGTRMYPFAAPQDAGLPNLAYQRISGIPELAHDGPAGLTQIRVQITCMASTYASAKALAATVVASLHGWKSGAVNLARVDNERDDWSALFTASVVRLDVVAWYQE